MRHKNEGETPDSPQTITLPACWYDYAQRLVDDGKAISVEDFVARLFELHLVGQTNWDHEQKRLGTEVERLKSALETIAATEPKTLTGPGVWCNCDVCEDMQSIARKALAADRGYRAASLAEEETT